MTKDVCILIASVALFLLGVKATFQYVEFIINKKKATATVIYSESVSIKTSRDFRLAIKYTNEYRNDVCIDTVPYKSDHSQNIPGNITIIYSKNSQALFVDGQKRTTWGISNLYDNRNSFSVRLCNCIGKKNCYKAAAEILSHCWCSALVACVGRLRAPEHQQAHCASEKAGVIFSAVVL